MVIWMCHNLPAPPSKHVMHSCAHAPVQILFSIEICVLIWLCTRWPKRTKALEVDWTQVAEMIHEAGRAGMNSVTAIPFH